MHTNLSQGVTERVKKKQSRSFYCSVDSARNTKKNQPELVSMCGCKLAKNRRNFTAIYLAWVKTYCKRF